MNDASSNKFNVSTSVGAPGARGGSARGRLPEVDVMELGAVGRPGALAAAAGATSVNRPVGWLADSAAASPTSSAPRPAPSSPAAVADANAVDPAATPGGPSGDPG